MFHRNARPDAPDRTARRAAGTHAAAVVCSGMPADDSLESAVLEGAPLEVAPYRVQF
ncbi:hypothetical protein [Zhihengliuella sp.]|uniref:hypothetical protein n=1 Tax=Zhihengliuella sp. TaxID=1954483 RepID=UPI0028123BAB|nr:hypothetical protein [Zhihengliuella sp.]